MGIKKIIQYTRGKLEQKYYLSLMFLEIPILSKKYKPERNFVEYRLFCCIPIMRRKYADKIKQIISQTHKQYQVILKKIQDKAKLKKPIKVRFFVVLDSAFGARAIFEKMLQDPCFQPFVVVIPDTSRGEEHCFKGMSQTYNNLIQSYPNNTAQILQSYDTNNQSFIDFAQEVDIAYCCNPYDLMTHFYYSILHLSNFALTIYVTYGYTGYFNNTKHAWNSLEYSILWNIYVENKHTYALIQESQIANVDNLSIVGYAKMDSLQEVLHRIQVNPERKKIILASHHTVLKDSSFCISNFLRLNEFFLELARMYPQIDFIFRPHPLLFITLTRFNVCETSAGGGG